ncbi:hypothetical protein HYT53_03700 [Candidatus Woesearchaeota archaeon]|nr:hypothetical protein [Candidatus Woesearchaeota archaeon]
MPKIIYNSLKESFALVWKNKLMFFLMLALQAGFFAAMFQISYIYVPKMIESQRAIDEYLSSLRLDEESVASSILEQKSILGDDPLLISRNFNEIVKNFRIYLVYIFILPILFMSIEWAVVHKVIHKTSLNQLTRNFLKIFVISLAYLGLVFIFFYSLLNIPITGIAEVSAKLLTKYVPFLILSIILAYFMLVSIALAQKTELKNVIQRTLIIGIKKIHYILAVYFINIFLFFMSAFLLYYFMEKSVLIMPMSIILILSSLVFGRMFMAKVVEKLA